MSSDIISRFSWENFWNFKASAAVVWWWFNIGCGSWISWIHSVGNVLGRITSTPNIRFFNWLIHWSTGHQCTAQHNDCNQQNDWEISIDFHIRYSALLSCSATWFKLDQTWFAFTLELDIDFTRHGSSTHTDTCTAQTRIKKCVFDCCCCRRHLRHRYTQYTYTGTTSGNKWKATIETYAKYRCRCLCVCTFIAHHNLHNFDYPKTIHSTHTHTHAHAVLICGTPKQAISTCNTKYNCLFRSHFIWDDDACGIFHLVDIMLRVIICSLFTCEN